MATEHDTNPLEHDCRGFVVDDVSQGGCRLRPPAITAPLLLGQGAADSLVIASAQTECVDNAFTNLIALNCGGAAFRVNNTTCTHNVIIRPQFDGNRQGNLSVAGPNLVTVR